MNPKFVFNHEFVWTNNFFGPKNLCAPIFFLTNIVFWPKILLDQTFFWTKKLLWTHKLFFAQNLYLDPKCDWTHNFFGTNFTWPFQPIFKFLPIWTLLTAVIFSFSDADPCYMFGWPWYSEGWCMSELCMKVGRLLHVSAKPCKQPKPSQYKTW